MYSTSIKNLHIPHFIYNAAGVWDTTVEQCQQLEKSHFCGATVTKSFTLNPRKGNEYPKYHFDNPHFSINSNGFENRGVAYYLYKLNPKPTHPVFFSIGGMSDDERISMLIKVSSQAREHSGIELNMSCPNLGCPGAAYDSKKLDEALRKIFEATGKISLTFGLKLPPYYLPEQFSSISDVIIDYESQIDFITCSNSIPNGIDFDVDNNCTKIAPNDGYGGIGGQILLPIGLANVRCFSQIFRSQELEEIAVIGCGGVCSGTDAYKYMLAGATAVQVGTHLWKNGPKVFTEIADEFAHIMNKKGYTSLAEIPGSCFAARRLLPFF
uniref:Dihydroorotate dehydrogenase n=1 Tax=Marseillevirus LCMAC202 TaxID=2506606 RepID=A0A481YXR4_9VIRU|nr:MAG: dihydroorotate dehydrogenase [Marseillevirus LCMAC202]